MKFYVFAPGKNSNCHFPPFEISKPNFSIFPCGSFLHNDFFVFFNMSVHFICFFYLSILCQTNVSVPNADVNLMYATADDLILFLLQIFKLLNIACCQFLHRRIEKNKCTYNAICFNTLLQFV